LSKHFNPLILPTVGTGQMRSPNARCSPIKLVLNDHGLNRILHLFSYRT